MRLRDFSVRSGIVKICQQQYLGLHWFILPSIGTRLFWKRKQWRLASLAWLQSCFGKMSYALANLSTKRFREKEGKSYELLQLIVRRSLTFRKSRFDLCNMFVQRPSDTSQIHSPSSRLLYSSTCFVSSPPKKFPS